MVEEIDETSGTSILIIDSGNVILNPLIEKFEAQEWAVTRLAEIGDAGELIRSGDISVALVDADKLDSARYHFAADLSRQHPEIVTILMVGFESQADLDYLFDDDLEYVVKPVRYKPIASMIRRGLRIRTLRKENRLLQTEVADLNEQIHQLSELLEASTAERRADGSNLPSPEGGVIRSYERQQQTLIRPSRRASRKSSESGKKDSSGEKK